MPCTLSSKRRILARSLLIQPQPQERSAYILGLTPASSLLLSFVDIAFHCLNMEPRTPSHHRHHSSLEDPEAERRKRLRPIVAPFANLTHAELNLEVEIFIEETRLHDDEDYLRRGAKLAQDKDAFLRPQYEREYRAEEKDYLRLESDGKGKDRFRQTWNLYALVIVCSIGAAVQGWDESAVSSGAYNFRE